MTIPEGQHHSSFDESTDYRRDLRLTEAVSIVVGRIIGSGIFATPGLIMLQVQCTSLFGLAWVLGGLMTVFSAACYAELVAMMPKSGGPYVYLKEAYGPLWAFLRGWAMFFVSETASIVAVALVFAVYLNAIVKIVTGTPFPKGFEIGVAFVAIWILTGINFFGVFVSGVFQNFFSSIKVVAVIAIIVIGFGAEGNSTNFVTPLFPDEFSWEFILKMAAAMRLVFFAFSGWEGATYVAEEVKNPRRNLPLSLFLGIGGIMVLYAGANGAYLYLLPPEVMAKSEWVATDAMKLALGSAGGILISAAIMMNTFGNVSTQILVKARSWQAMARDGLFFKKFAVIHPKYRTPNNALFAQAVWATVLLGFSSTAQSSYKALIDFFFATGTIFNIMTLASVFVLRKKYPDLERPYRAWLYPYSMIIVILLYVVMLVLSLIAVPLESLAGLALTSSGLIYYYYLHRNRKKENPDG